ncbi:Allergen protein [Mycena sanguinolenta]|uniref:Allergen protein n=1 Tax=Mycena sanguinolenta TaxID=230812 RepID=A0A8H7DLK2_9AGAR|nr:Allergen protein [Mycena sanguinolenta]
MLTQTYGLGQLRIRDTRSASGRKGRLNKSTRRALVEQDHEYTFSFAGPLNSGDLEASVSDSHLANRSLFLPILPPYASFNRPLPCTVNSAAWPCSSAHGVSGTIAVLSPFRFGLMSMFRLKRRISETERGSTSSPIAMPHSAFRFLLLLSALSATFSSPAGLEARAAADNTVYVTSTDKFCMIMPRTPHTNIGDSEHPGGMQSYCSPNGRYDSSQGKLPAQFWRNVAFKSGTGKKGGRYAQLTGCIRPELLDRLNPRDSGGQYDSSGGAGGRGNPQGSVCLGYKHYVELVEPAGPRACIKCCDDPTDCPTNKDTQGCPAVIPGNYFNCG